MRYLRRPYWTSEKLPWLIVGTFALALFVGGWFVTPSVTKTHTVVQQPPPVVVHVTVSPSPPRASASAKPAASTPVLFFEPAAQTAQPAPARTAAAAPRPSAHPTPAASPTPSSTPRPSPSPTRICVSASGLISLCH